MRAKIRTIACLSALFAISSGFSQNVALAQENVSGLWMSSEGDVSCPLFAIEILKNGNGEAWTMDGERDPMFSDLEGKVRVNGGRIESNMAEGGAGIARMSLRGTVSGNQIMAQVTLTEGRKKLSGSCVFTRK